MPTQPRAVGGDAVGRHPNAEAEDKIQPAKKKTGFAQQLYAAAGPLLSRRQRSTFRTFNVLLTRKIIALLRVKARKMTYISPPTDIAGSDPP